MTVLMMINRSVSLTNRLLRCSKAQTTASSVEPSGSECSNGSQSGSQFVLIVSK